MGKIAAKTTKLVATVGRSFDFEGSEDDGSEAEDNDLGYYGDWSEEAAESESSVKAVRVSGARCAAWPSLRDDSLAMDEVLARCLAWIETNDWIGLFNTRLGCQTTREKLWAGRNHPTKAGSIAQAVEETVSLLLAMGLDRLSYPPEFNLREWSAAKAGAELREFEIDGSYADRGGQRSGRDTCGRRLSNHRSGYSSDSDDSFGSDDSFDSEDSFDSDDLLEDDDDIWDKIDDDPRVELDRQMKALGNVDNMF
ncbi:hypothetical protein PC121_g20053 [Phytophthora cactorum]|nr:hypothetical protein PC121_g20053 [Phytophthora cactorum]KAG4042972.1 hypothetical protein PC123_g21555 [Phytophthora cactorum]